MQHELRVENISIGTVLQEFAVAIQSKVQHNGKFRLPYHMQLNLLQNRIYLDSWQII